MNTYFQGKILKYSVGIFAWRGRGGVAWYPMGLWRPFEK